MGLSALQTGERRHTCARRSLFIALSLDGCIADRNGGVGRLGKGGGSRLFFEADALQALHFVRAQAFGESVELVYQSKLFAAE